MNMNKVMIPRQKFAAAAKPVRAAVRANMNIDDGSPCCNEEYSNEPHFETDVVNSDDIWD